MDDKTSPGIGSRIRQSLLKFPPDPSLGYVPQNYRILRTLITFTKMGYTLIPLLLFRKFQVLVLLNTYDHFTDALVDLLKILPFVLLYLFKYPLKAAEDRLRKDWYREVTIDFLTDKNLLTERLPQDDTALNAYNSYINIAGDLSYAPAYGLGLFSLTLSGFQSILFFGLGILSLVINGYLTGAWVDTNVRVAVRDFVEDNNVEKITETLGESVVKDLVGLKQDQR